MDENEQQTLDNEYKRYLEIMRPYLGQLLDQDVIEICNAWIQRLSSCKDNEKVLRNKYVFTMCYQLAKGILEYPFLKKPTSDNLPPLPDGTYSENSVNESTEVECLVLDLDSTDAKLLYNNHKLSATEYLSRNSEIETDQSKNESQNEVPRSIDLNHNKEYNEACKHTVTCFNCPTSYNTCSLFAYNENYENRAKNLVTKLREIKNQNVMLRNELKALKEHSKNRHHLEEIPHTIFKVDTSTNAYISSQGSNTTINSLKCKLQEVQECRNSLIETIRNLQDKLDNFEEIKRHEMEEIQAQHKLEIIKVKNLQREELKTNFDSELDKIKQNYEFSIKDINSANLKEIEKRESIISEKDKLIEFKETQIKQLTNTIDDLKNNQLSMFSKVLEYTKDDSNTKNMKDTTEEFEKKLNKMEKSKLKSCRAYETKLANLQREKHLAECALQLQLVKERAQIINETADEYQMELGTSLDKLECKYKDIVANVQATAVQRRIQDQMALESIIHAVCGIRNEGMHTNNIQATLASHLPNKAMCNQTREGIQTCNNDIPTLFPGNKVGSIIVGNKPYGDESFVTGYCLESEKLEELFERVCIPQRDTGECSPKKS